VRILFVTHNVPRFPGDLAGSFVLRLAVGLQQRGARVEIIAPGATDLAPSDTLDGVAISRIPYAANAAMTLAYTGTMVEQVTTSWRARLALVGMLRALRRATRERIRNANTDDDPFDVVHTHWWFPSGLALWRLGTPQRTESAAPTRVLTMHGSDVRLAQKIAPARWLMAAVCGEYDVRTAVSTWLASTAMQSAPAGRVAVAPMPVDTSRFTLPHDVPRSGLLFVGRLNAQKGAADLLSALARPALREALGEGLVHLVGEGADREPLIARAIELGISDRLRWHGVLNPEALAALYQRAIAVVMPSREEGLGLVAVEAQLCGAAVVAYDSGGIRDVVNPAFGGTLVKVGDLDALAAAITLLLLDPASASDRGRRAHDVMAARFSPDAVAAHYLSLYRAEGPLSNSVSSAHHSPDATRQPQ
jgi:glycosyltransferase involved in cell wall biosynthesis